jgi:hypothetical protein
MVEGQQAELNALIRRAYSLGDSWLSFSGSAALNKPV